MELCEVLVNVALKERYGKRWATRDTTARDVDALGGCAKPAKRAWPNVSS